MNESIDRVPPHNQEAEQSVIGAIFLEPQALVSVAEIVMPEDFYRVAHQRIFQTMIDLTDRGKAVDLVTVTEELSVKKELEDVGGLSYLTEIANAVPTAANVGHYAHIVEEKALLRRLIRVATTIVEDGFSREDEVEALLDGLSEHVLQTADTCVRFEDGDGATLPQWEPRVVRVRHFASLAPFVGAVATIAWWRVAACLPRAGRT